jgi:hypothetical protein
MSSGNWFSGRPGASKSIYQLMARILDSHSPIIPFPLHPFLSIWPAPNPFPLILSKRSIALSMLPIETNGTSLGTRNAQNIGIGYCTQSHPSAATRDKSESCSITKKTRLSPSLSCGLVSCGIRKQPARQRSTSSVRMRALNGSEMFILS